ncbi:MAG: isochorismatase family protein [Kiritimatiellae bacterium]|nr:isochorismatase family protein [Kiritimatiellia bacterium]
MNRRRLLRARPRHPTNRPRLPKGTDKTIDSYSGLYDNGHRKATGHTDWLRKHGVTRVVLTGLATDFCVKFTALDAVKDGFDTIVWLEACRGIFPTRKH